MAQEHPARSRARDLFRQGASELFDLLGQREEDVKALISGVPGFVNYAAVRSGDGGECPVSTPGAL
jgi:hypothetical protein